MSPGGGRSFTGAEDICFDAIREAKLDRLADLIADHLDRDRPAPSYIG